MKLRTKLLVKHRPDCGASNMVRNYGWFSPWWFNGEPIYRDALGRKNGSGERWLMCECAYTDCPAKLIVAENDILKAMVKGDGVAFHPSGAEAGDA